MLGQQGLVEVALDPVGWVRVQGERWRAQADAPLASGATVTVVAVEGLSLKVRGGA
jgi:membrane-bound ClpP family serine protease